MRKIYGFKTSEEAERYADKNLYTDTFEVYETSVGNFAIKFNNNY